MAYTNKLESMALTIRTLEAKHESMTSTYGTRLAVTLRESIRIAGEAILTLKGENVKPGDVNPWQRALDDDAYLKDAWIPLAEDTARTMNEAMGLSEKWSFTGTFSEVYSNFANAAPSKSTLFGGLGLVAVIVVALAVIVVWK